jgi:hypothetical protein
MTWAPCSRLIIMDALMYGITPIEKMANCPKAPPENIFRIPNKDPDCA